MAAVYAACFCSFSVCHLFGPTISVTTDASGRKVPIHSVDTVNRQVAVSFDAAWGNDDTMEILDILEEYQVKTTFFVTGEWAESFPEDVIAITDAGHELGNHSDTHQHMTELSKKEMEAEITATHEKILAMTGIEMTLFRAPFADFNNQLITTVNQLGYHAIQFSIDSYDWKDYGAANIVSAILDSEKLDNGAIILLHNGSKYTKDALADVLSGLRDMGFEIVPVSELIYTGNYYTDQEGRQFQNR